MFFGIELKLNILSNVPRVSFNREFKGLYILNFYYFKIPF